MLCCIPMIVLMYQPILIGTRTKVLNCGDLYLLLLLIILRLWPMHCSSCSIGMIMILDRGHRELWVILILLLILLILLILKAMIVLRLDRILSLSHCRKRLVRCCCYRMPQILICRRGIILPRRQRVFVIRYGHLSIRVFNRK